LYIYTEGIYYANIYDPRVNLYKKKFTDKLYNVKRPINPKNWLQS